MPEIHPTAVVDPRAGIGRGVTVGPYAVIGPRVTVGDDCVIDAHVKLTGDTEIGPRTRIYFGAVVGEDPQDHRFVPGVRSFTRVGSDVTLREYVTIHRSPFPDAVTEVGDGSLLMAFVHVGHDARLGRRVTVANNSVFAGHVTVEDGAVVSAYVLVHQFCRIGALAMVGGRTLVRQDVPPFCMLGEDNSVCGPNVVGLRRAGYDDARRLVIRKIIKHFFFRDLNAAQALERIAAEFPGDADAEAFTEFIRGSQRGVMPGNPALCRIAAATRKENEP